MSTLKERTKDFKWGFSVKVTEPDKRYEYIYVIVAANDITEVPNLVCRKLGVAVDQIVEINSVFKVLE